jgi:pyroglutamyl-peptidase
VGTLVGERCDRRVRILLTGFGRFPGAPANPSAAIVAAIAHAGSRRFGRCGIDVVAAVLPVDFERIGEELAEHLAAAEPDAVLHLGLAARRRALTVETRAMNRLSQLHPDAHRHTPALPTVLPGAPERRDVRLPVLRLAAVMGRSGVPTRLSNDAGAYVCNATLFRTLGATVPLAGFIHVPWPCPENRPLSRRRPGPARPRFAAMVAAITAALMLVGAQARRNRRQLPHTRHGRSSCHALTEKRVQT